MRALLYKFVFVAALALMCLPTPAQDAPSGANAQPGDFFSGIVVSFTTAEIKVNRKGLGKETAATRTFVIDASTKVEGSIAAKAHVTVRFVGDESSARAVHILVR